MMTAKDFRAIAKVTNEETITDKYGFKFIPVDVLTYQLADYFETINAKFDKDRFLKACGVEEWNIC